jgi:hypothetical protein
LSRVLKPVQVLARVSRNQIVYFSKLVSSNGARGQAPRAAILTDNFTNFQKLPNQTNCYEVDCCYCPNGTPLMTNCDNKPIKHLADPKLCPNAPSDVRNQALMFLAGKKAGGALIIQTTMSEPMNGSTPAIMGIYAMSTGDSSSQVVVVKKRKATGMLAGMVDYMLMEVQKKWRSLLSPTYSDRNPIGLRGFLGQS